MYFPDEEITRVDKIGEVYNALLDTTLALERMEKSDLEELERRCEGRFTVARMKKEIRQLLREVQEGKA